MKIKKSKTINLNLPHIIFIHAIIEEGRDLNPSLTTNPFSFSFFNNQSFSHYLDKTKIFLVAIDRRFNFLVPFTLWHNVNELSKVF